MMTETSGRLKLMSGCKEKIKQSLKNIFNVVQQAELKFAVFLTGKHDFYKLKPYILFILLSYMFVLGAKAPNELTAERRAESTCAFDLLRHAAHPPDPVAKLRIGPKLPDPPFFA